jgi:hypothetical protein
MATRHRFLVTAVVLASAFGAQAQQKWTPPRTPDGQPDISGVWTAYTITPFERPARWANKATLTPEEVKAFEEETAKNRANPARRDGDVGSDTWLDQGDKMLYGGQTSMVVDPPDGRVPVTPEGEKRHAYILAHNGDSWEYMSTWDRCLTRGVPGGMFPGANDNGYQIYQSPGFVVIYYEMIHEAHIIPLDLPPNFGRAPGRLPDDVRQLNGDSHGRWEGNTLVVETTNYDGKAQLATSSIQGRLKEMPETTAMRIVERFTRLNESILNYEVTIDDPPIYSRPWTVRIPLNHETNYRVLEYSCHEGNTATELTLKGARALEKAASEGKK